MIYIVSKKQHSSLPVSLSLDEQALKPVMNVFVEQLKLLLGVPSINDRNVDAPDILTSSNHIPLWFVIFIIIINWLKKIFFCYLQANDYLVRSHLYENLITTTTTLQSLSSLVESLTTMKVLDHIKTLLEVFILFYFLTIFNFISFVCLVFIVIIE